jgi:predicted HicB family RNase H-like nuclease
MAVMEHEGYVGSIEFDEQENVFHGRVINTRDVITFEGRSVDELRRALADSIADYRAMCVEDGVEPEKPFSGKFMVRVAPELHRQAFLAAVHAHKSLSAFVREAISDRVAEELREL